MPLISYQEALARVLEQVPAPRPETVSLEQSLGRTLAAPVRADTDMPPFNKSFMDGYALRSQDVQSVPTFLSVVGTVAAGARELPRIGRNQAVEIMTGAPVPDTADSVVMVEKTRRHGTRVEVLDKVVSGQHLALRGSEVEKGQVVLVPGSRIGPRETAVLACFGCARVETWKPPSVAIVSTGDELVEIERTPGFGEIRNSNAHMLRAQCRELGLDTRVEPIVRDDPQAVREAVRKALQRDLAVLSGGVSMGEFDYVHRVLADEGVEIAFHKAAIKPGKPIVVGRRGNHLLFGLPGNPVSSFVTFVLFVRPAVQQWCGREPRGAVQVRASLASEVRHTPGRRFFMPARVQSTREGLTVHPVRTRGSADIVGFAGANALLDIPARETRLAPGSPVDVLVLEW